MAMLIFSPNVYHFSLIIHHIFPLWADIKDDVYTLSQFTLNENTRISLRIAVLLLDDLCILVFMVMPFLAVPLLPSLSALPTDKKIYFY